MHVMHGLIIINRNHDRFNFVVTFIVLQLVLCRLLHTSSHTHKMLRRTLWNLMTLLRNVMAPKMNAVYLQGTFTKLKAASAAGTEDLDAHAYLGDRIFGLLVALHLEHKVRNQQNRRASLHELAQFYITETAQAACFDFIQLEKPAPGNSEFSLHTKAQKLEQLLSYLDKGTSGQSRKQFIAVLKWMLHRGDVMSAQYTKI